MPDLTALEKLQIIDEYLLGRVTVYKGAAESAHTNHFTSEATFRLIQLAYEGDRATVKQQLGILQTERIREAIEKVKVE